MHVRAAAGRGQRHLSEPATKAEYALTDFAFFVEQYLGMPLWQCQKRWADEFQTVVDSSDYDGLQRLAPADHGKTSRIVVPGILWLLARDKTNRIGLVGNTDDYAYQIGRAVKTRIDRMPALEKEFGLRRGIKWADNEIHIERPNVLDKDPSLLCLGAGADVQSQRFDYLFTDDLATRRNSRTEQQREAIRTYFMTDLGSRLDKTMTKRKTFVYGHRVADGDLYVVNAGRKRWLYGEDKAIVNDSEKRILAPEGHTYEELSEMRSLDPTGFELMYQQQSAALGRFVTRTSMENARVKELKFIQTLTPAIRGEFKATWMAIDPAFSTNRWSSYMVMGLWGMRFNGQRVLLWATRDKVTPESLLTLMELKFRMLMPDKFFIEGNQGQILLIPHMRRRFPEHTSKFVPVFTTNKDGRLEEEIARMFDLYNGDKPKVEIPYAGVSEQAYAHAMLEEYCSYPDGRTRDMIMMQYIGEKGMGLLVEETRRGYVRRQGIIGAVAASYRKRVGFGVQRFM